MALPAPADPEVVEGCRFCAGLIEEPRVAVGLSSCWPCSAVDPASPPWDIGPAEVEGIGA